MVGDPETLQPVPADGETQGEVFLRGNVIMSGYLKVCFAFVLEGGGCILRRARGWLLLLLPGGGWNSIEGEGGREVRRVPSLQAGAD